MSEKKPNLITIDDVEHDLDAMTDEQRLLVNHCIDLERKIASTQFNLDQLTVGKQAFVQMLKEKLAAPKAEIVEAVETVQ
jgi:cell division septum initiation protein DivIVA